MLKAAKDTLPSRTFVPTVRHDGHEYLATYGWSVDDDSDDSDDKFKSKSKYLIVGRGDCPHEAVKNFDQKWYGEFNK